MLPTDVLVPLEVFGVFVAAVSGALLAVRRDFDLVGMVVLATLTGIGGGVLRDLLLGETPPASFRSLPYLLTPVAAALLTFWIHPHLEGALRRPVLLFDAAAVGVFALTGTVKSLSVGAPALASVLLGSISAVGGGVMRDIGAREVPALFRSDSDLYSIPVVLGCAIIAATWSLDAFTPAVGAAVVVLVFVIRVLALRFHWRAPAPSRRRR